MISVLVAEGDTTLRSTLQAFFEMRVGYQVAAYPNGMEASRFLKRYEFNAFIIGEKMPWVDGEELYNRIRKLDKHSNTPIFMTTDSASQLSPDLLSDSNFHVVEKPFQLDVFFVHFEKVVEDAKKNEDKADSKIDIEMIDAFVKTTEAVLRHLSGIDSIESLRPYVHRPDHRLGMDVNEFVQFESDGISGTIGLMFRKDAFLWLASVVGGVSHVIVDKATTECGKITKKVQKSMWTKLGLPYKEEAHKVYKTGHHMGDGFVIDQSVKAPTIVVPIRAPFGDCSALLRAKRTVTTTD